MKSFRMKFLGTTSMLAIGLCTTMPGLVPAAAARTDVASDVVMIEDVVVTAQKREEPLQSVPVAVTALSGDQLKDRGITNSRDLFQVVPGLTFTQGGNQPQFQIRGVGTRGSGPGDEPAVPIYIDGIYQATQLNSLLDLGGIQRIEVLKGPQGTLFGRNAEGGAINIVTLDPGQDFRFEASADYASFNQRKADVFIASPLSDTVSASFSAHMAADGGYVKNVYLNKMTGKSDSVSMRGKLVWRPVDQADLTLTGFYGAYNDNAVQVTSTVGTNNISFLPARGGSPDIVYTNAPRTTAAAYEPYNNNENYGAALVGHYYFTDFDITALGSYQNSKSRTFFDLTQSPTPILNIAWQARDEVYTGEVRATSSGEGPFKWIVGAFYFNATNGYPLQVTNGTSISTPLVTTNRNLTDAYSFFAEGTYAFWERLELTLGVRYSEERRDQTVAKGTLQDLGTPSSPGDVLGRGTAVLGAPIKGNKTFTDTSPRVTLKYAFTPETQVYATYSQGFKSGLYNASTVSNPLVPVGPETLGAYQVGLKTMLAPNIRLNVEAFDYKYDGMQLNVRSTTGITQLQNAANATMYGGEAALDWAVTSNWNMNLGVTYTHSRFDNFPNAIIYRPFVASDAGASAQLVTLNGTPTYVGNFTDAAYDATGNALPKTPLWTMNLASSYAIPLSDGGRIVLAGDMFFSTNFWFNANNSYGTGDYSIVNLSAGWELPDGHLKLTAYVTNVGDTDLITYFNESASGTFAAWNRPRMFGVTLQYKL